MKITKMMKKLMKTERNKIKKRWRKLIKIKQIIKSLKNLKKNIKEEIIRRINEVGQEN